MMGVKVKLVGDGSEFGEFTHGLNVALHRKLTFLPCVPSIGLMRFSIKKITSSQIKGKICLISINLVNYPALKDGA
jgi:hypothetical protein